MSTYPEEESQPEMVQLPRVVRQRLVELGAPLLLTEAEGRLALAERKMQAFEQRYETTITQLHREGLPDDASMEMHEDFIEWSGWQRTYEESREILSSLKPFLEKPLAAPVAG